MPRLTDPAVAARLKSDRAAGQARALRKQLTPMEKRLWRQLREHAPNEQHWRKQVAIGPYIADFGCHGAKLVVELDGAVHETAAARERDKKREAFLVGRGYRVLRFSNADVKADVGLVVRSILDAAARRTLPPCGGG